MVAIFVIWIFLSLLVALFGAGRKIGFNKSLLASILLTPLLGVIIAAFSQSKKDAAKKKEMDRLSKEYLDLIKSKK